MSSVVVGRLRVSALALSLGVSWLVVPSVQAQACCSAASVADFGVVGPHSRSAVVAAQLGADYALASIDADEDAHPLSSARALDTTLSLGAGIRLLRKRVQVHGSIPLRLQYRALDGLSSATAVGVGDTSLGLRWHAVRGSDQGFDLNDAASFVPSIDLYVLQRFPTGRPPDRSTDPTGADTMGDGHFETQLGVRLGSVLARDHTLLLHAAYGIRYAHDVDTQSGSRRVTPGDTLNTQLTWMYTHDIFMAGGVFAAARFAFTEQDNGSDVPSSATRRVRLGAYVTRALFYPDWDLTVSVSSDAMLNGLERNLPFAGVQAALTVQRTFP